MFMLDFALDSNSGTGKSITNGLVTNQFIIVMAIFPAINIKLKKNQSRKTEQIFMRE